LTQLVDEVPEGMRAGILAEAVVAYADSNAATEAVEAATELRRNYPDSPWAQWAIRATYDLENLQPGMEAPAFALVDREGQSLTSSSLSGRFVILEFFDPLEPIFQREMAVRDYLAGTIPEALFQYVSVSVEADEAVNQALLEEGARPGRFVFSDEGIEQQIVQDFNVHIMPTRFLIDPDGRIVARYTGPALDDLESDLITIINSVNELADRLPQRP
jgi:cytochrome oxidase Cu insertion factor (SCO1/SenC/PrrC family)